MNNLEMNNKALKPYESTLQNGKYTIKKVLGQGGFGISYEAEQVLLGRKVAIKEFFMNEYCERDKSTNQVTIPSTGSRELVDRFRQKFIKEACMIASFDHPNIVKIHDIFEENDTAYYVMEFISNGSLYEKVKQGGALPENEAEKYIREIANALGYIHIQNILHLDVKPANILLNTAGAAVLVDFGISKHYDRAGVQTSSTPLGVSKGYAPLEQYQQGDVNRFSPSTDIYSLGATLYYLSTGTPPPDASSVYEDGLERPAGISDKIWYTIERSMQPRRKDRPQNVDAFLDVLNRTCGATKETKRDSDETINVGYSKKNDKDCNEKNSNNGFNENDDSTLLQLNDKTRSSGKAKKENNVVLDHEYVDLGLSVKWATCNVGATKPEDYGEYYAWGEIKSKNIYNDHSYIHSKINGLWSNYVFIKYNTKQRKGIKDDKSKLELIDDVAKTEWGVDWRIPSVEEFQELLNNCKWEWTELNGIKSYKVSSKKDGYLDRFIILPANGFRNVDNIEAEKIGGYYWSNTLNTSRPVFAMSLKICNTSCCIDSSERVLGYAIRPVCL